MAAGMRPLVAVGRAAEARKLGEEMMASAESFGLEGFAAMTIAGVAGHSGLGNKAVAAATAAIDLADERGGLGMFDARVTRALGLLLIDRPDDALDDLSIAVEMYAASGFAGAVVALSHVVHGEFDAAVVSARAVLEMPESTYLDRTFAAVALTTALVHQGDEGAARVALAEAILSASGTQDVTAVAILRRVEACLGFTSRDADNGAGGSISSSDSGAVPSEVHIGDWTQLIDRLTSVSRVG
jgi:hypothetical protein